MSDPEEPTTAEPNTATSTEIHAELVGAFVLAQMLCTAHPDPNINAAVGTALQLMNKTLCDDAGATLTDEVQNHASVCNLRKKVQACARKMHLEQQENAKADAEKVQKAAQTAAASEI